MDAQALSPAVFALGTGGGTTLFSGAEVED
jgi:hypothetical protein